MTLQCHSTCLTCSDTTFTSCLTCSSDVYALAVNTCMCIIPWQEQCVGEQLTGTVRRLIHFCTMFTQLFLIGLAFLYLLNVKMPISYRIWNSLGNLSLLVFSPVLQLQYQDEYILKQLFSFTNGPYLFKYRISNLSTNFIIPTVIIMGILIILYPLMYFIYSSFQTHLVRKMLSQKQKNSVSEFEQSKFQEESEDDDEEEKNKYLSCTKFIQYLKFIGGHFVESFVFFSSRLMLYVIGMAIASGSSTSLLYIILTCIYGCILFVVYARMIKNYHINQVNQSIYESAIYIYTMLAPLSIIGLPLVTSKQLLSIIFCSPIVLLILILIFNRKMKVFTIPKVKFYSIELLLIGINIAFIFVNNKIKTFFLITILLLFCIIMCGEGIYVQYFNGYDLSNIKVNPEKEKNPVSKKKILIQDEKQGYF